MSETTYFTSTLAEAFDCAGLPFPGTADPGKIIRFSTNQRDKHDRAGWLSMLPDGLGAAFGDWRSGESFCWQMRDSNANPPSQEEREAARQDGEKARKQAEHERTEAYAKAASECAAQWAKLEPATAAHEYLQRKEIAPHLARVDSSGKLALPVFDARGDMQSLQFIAPDGSKRFYPGGKMVGGLLYLGKPTDGKPLVLVEGYATGVSIFEAAGVAVCVGFAGSNLRHVAETLRRLFPNSPLLVAGDLDEHGAGRKYAEAAAEAGAPARVVFPVFADGRAAGDFNDLSTAEGPEAVRRQVMAALRDDTARLSAPSITAEELANARPTPDCIVRNLYFADVGTLIAAGGTGKTTLMMHILCCIVTGRDCLGEKVVKHGPVLLLTAEDGREILVARLRSIMDGLDLDASERATVMRDLRIADVSGEGFKLTEVASDVVLPGANVDELIAAAKAINPVLIVIDPAVSFGVGEQRVNDAEQGLIEAGRKLRNALNCAVVYVHHSGKANARDKTLDQYSGRGGSAFADGSRMVHVLAPLTPDEWEAATGETFADGETGLILARPKMSYCPPPGDIYIRRNGFHFERVEAAIDSKADRIERTANQVWQLLTEELKHGRRHSKKSVEDADAGNLKRNQIRAALSWLEVTGRVEMRKRPDAGQRGAREYLHPIVPSEKAGFGSPDDGGETSAKTDKNEGLGSSDESAVFASPPYREKNGGEASRHVLSPSSLASPESDGEATARRARRDLEPLQDGVA